ncbi:hypothetical protein CDL15_Pgr003130 [Punica granatum]|nr:hypothetical protein CDL15_Pgr003130 [Punica granatum]
MKIGSKTLAALFALFLIASSIISFSSLPLCHGRIIRPEDSSSLLSRRLMMTRNAATVNVSSGSSKTPGRVEDDDSEEAEKAVEASLRKVPPSVPNPTQNK